MFIRIYSLSLCVSLCFSLSLCLSFSPLSIRMITYRKDFPSIKSSEPLITWPFEVTWQIKRICRRPMGTKLSNVPTNHQYPSHLKSASHLSKKKKFICFNDSLSKMMKNAFYFILKTLFVLKIFKFLSWRFGHVEKAASLER